MLDTPYYFFNNFAILMQFLHLSTCSRESNSSSSLRALAKAHDMENFIASSKVLSFSVNATARPATKASAAPIILTIS